MARRARRTNVNEGNEMEQFAEQTEEVGRHAGENLAATAEISGTLMRGWVELGNECMHLMQAVYHHNVEGMSRLVRARTPAEWSRIQSELMLYATEEVIQLTHRIADKSKQVASEAEKRLERNGRKLHIVA